MVKPSTEASVTYWLNVALAVFFIWRASTQDDRGAMFYLFGAAFLLIHAHGRRIQETLKESKK